MAELRVLVVDDDAMLCRAMCRMLRPFEVTIAGGGEEALALLADASFDIILCDVMMPELTGPELYHRLAPDLQRRVLFMTGGMLDRVQSLMEGVPKRLIEKPFSRAAIKATIETMAAQLADPSPEG